MSYPLYQFLDDIELAVFVQTGKELHIDGWETDTHVSAEIVFPDRPNVVITLPKNYNNLWPLRCQRAVKEALEISRP